MIKLQSASAAKALFAFCFFAGSANLAAAEESSSPRQLRFEIGGGGGIAPAYEGASRYQFSGSGKARFISLKSERFNIGGGETQGWSIGPSFNIVGERKASDDPILTGIADVDLSVELGLSVGYEWEHFRASAAIRYGVIGHNSFVGELKADGIWRPNDKTRITLGPRISFADQSYMDTYFTVPVTATRLTPSQASSGLKSVGAEMTIRHDFNERWAMEASGRYDRLVGGAGDSPIAAAGSRNQFFAKIGLVRKFNLEF